MATIRMERSGRRIESLAGGVVQQSKRPLKERDPIEDLRNRQIRDLVAPVITDPLHRQQQIGHLLVVGLPFPPFDPSMRREKGGFGGILLWLRAGYPGDRQEPF